MADLHVLIPPAVHQGRVEIMLGGPRLARQENVRWNNLEVIKVKILCVNTKLLELNLFYNLES